MCGVNGIIKFDNQVVTRKMLENMNEKMLHRGPDDDGYWIDRQVGLGFRRLSIIDVDTAQQPIVNETGSMVIICNGEIYNYKELRELLIKKGHIFKTKGDTETVLHLYEEYGKECVNHLRGMFAFIIWDKLEDTFFVARDHFGIKPLYFSYDKSQFICSSELKSILAQKTTVNEIDEQSLIHYLTYQYVPQPRTMIKDVSKLPPGHRMIIKNKQISIEEYWVPVFEPAKETSEQMKEKIRDTLEESVKLHLLSDVPTGSFLSSGIDSTAITALMNKKEKHKTFSIGFEGKQNECVIARKTAEILGTEHYESIVTETDYFSAVAEAVWFQDDPVADPSSIPLFLLSKMASEHVKVILSGEGADELFGGYRIYQEPDSLRHFNWMNPAMKNTFHHLIERTPDFYGRNYLMRGSTSLYNRFIGNAKIFTTDLPKVLANHLSCDQYQTAFEHADQYYQQVNRLDDVTKMQFIDMNLWLPGNILAKGDKMSMAYSLELRVPFLDRALFEVAHSIPTSMKVSRTTTKKIFREAMENLVPPHVINRAKLGFPVPLKDWLRGPRGNSCHLTIQSSGIKKYINMEYTEKLFSDHQTGKVDNARKIWALYILSLWYESYIVGFNSEKKINSSKLELISLGR